MDFLFFCEWHHNGIVINRSRLMKVSLGCTVSNDYAMLWTNAQTTSLNTNLVNIYSG